MLNLETSYIHDIAPETDGSHSLLLMLPGAKNTPQQLVDFGFIAALRKRQLAIDVLALNAHVDFYLDQRDISHLLHQTLASVRSYGYRRIWILGVSLGATGAMICATQYSSEIEGIFLLAPFLGTRGLIAEVQAAGGLSHWLPGEISRNDHERALLQQIRCRLDTAEGFPPIHLGYGSEDRFRGASIMLSAHLPPQRVAVAAGGHDWQTWQQLWHSLLDTEPFGPS